MDIEKYLREESSVLVEDKAASKNLWQVFLHGCFQD